MSDENQIEDFDVSKPEYFETILGGPFLQN